MLICFCIRKHLKYSSNVTIRYPSAQLNRILAEVKPSLSVLLFSPLLQYIVVFFQSFVSKIFRDLQGKSEKYIVIIGNMYFQGRKTN